MKIQTLKKTLFELRKALMIQKNVNVTMDFQRNVIRRSQIATLDFRYLSIK